MIMAGTELDMMFQTDPIFNVIVNLITSVLARADGVYADAQGYLDDIVTGTNLTYSTNTDTVVTPEGYDEPTGITTTDVPVSITMGTVTRPTIPMLGIISTDVADLAEVDKPNSVILSIVSTDDIALPTVTSPGAIVLPHVSTNLSLDTVTEPLPIVMRYVDTGADVAPVTAPTIVFIDPGIPTVPSLSDVPEPDLSFSYNEAWYTTELGSTLYANLLDELKNGSTGLTYSVESDIYNRDFERDTLELQRTKDKIANIWAESGMSLPDGVLVSALNAAEIDFQNKYSDKSRDVRIESFKRADDNAKFVKDMTVKFEQVITDYMGKYYDRKLEAAKATLTYAQAIYDSLIKYQSLYIERYKAETEGYKAIVEAQAAVYDAEAKVYASEVQYALGVAEIGTKNVSAELESQKNHLSKSQLAVAVYDSEVKYATAKADVEAKIIAYDLEIQKNILAKKQIEVSIYDSEIKHSIAYADTEVKKVSVDLDVQKNKIAKGQLDVAVYDSDIKYAIADSEIDIKRIAADIDIQKNVLGKGQLDVALYDADVKYEMAAAEIEAKEVAMKLEKQKTAAAVYQAEVQFSDVDMRYHLGKAEIAMKTVQANIELLKLQVQAAVSATGNVAQVSSTMVAGALSALNANASLGLSEGFNTSDSTSTNKSSSISQSSSSSSSYNEDHNYEE
jgi:hypothetical protein